MSGYFDELKSASMNSRSGGGSGTSDYDELQNKPSVNGNTLAGNKTSSQLGLQSEINSESKLDADLVSDENSTNKFTNATEKAVWNGKQDAIADLSAIRSGASAGATALQQSDVVSTYSASGAAPVNGTAINDAIGTLDVAPVGGAGKVISAISETNGKISPTVVTMDTNPTESSTNPVTSGGVAESQSKQDAEIAWNANHGVKNLVELDPATYTSGNVNVKISDDGTVSVSLTSGSTANTTFSRAIKNITSLRDKDLILSGCPAGGSYSSGYALYISDDSTTKEKDEGAGVLVPKSTSVVSSQLAIIIRSGTTISGTLEFKPMLRPAAIKDATYCKYAPSNRELYEMILALQSSGSRSLSMQSESLTKKAEQEEIKDSENEKSILYPD